MNEDLNPHLDPDSNLVPDFILDTNSVYNLNVNHDCLISDLSLDPGHDPNPSPSLFLVSIQM